MPGQLHFGAAPLRLETLLGSCVAITLWHPRLRIGGMCHYLLPQRVRAQREPLDGRYGDEAIELLVQALHRAGTRAEDYEAHMYGGADTMPDNAGVKFDIGMRNIEAGWNALDRLGCALRGVDVGDNVPRRVWLDVASGEVTMQRGGPRPHGA